MLNKFFNKKKDNKGFTLVELVIVVAILAILVGLLAPQYTKYVEKSRKSADASNLENMVKAVEIAAADASESIPVGTYTITIGASATTVAKTNGDGDASKVDAAIKEFVDKNYANTAYKSKKWSDAGSEANLVATIEVDKDGATTVSYAPNELAKYIGKAAASATTTPEVTVQGD